VSGPTYSVPLSEWNNSKANASAALMSKLEGLDVIIDETYAADPAKYGFDESEHLQSGEQQ